MNITEEVLMKLPLFQRLFACITNNRLDEYDPSRNSEIYYDIASQKFINIDESYDMIVKNICLGDLLPYTTDFIINNNLTKEIIVLPPSAHSLKNRYYGIFISKNTTGDIPSFTSSKCFTFPVVINSSNLVWIVGPTPSSSSSFPSLRRSST